jgi:peptidoglycan hydrolase CwlO-like protein
VRQIIKDLVAKLEADKMNEATRKGYCDTNMASSVAQRDSANDKLEELEAKLSALSAEEAALTGDIATLHQEIAANAKALNEATELRLGEKATNEKTISDATEGKTGVELALQILTDFYSAQGVLFAQYVPPDSDRNMKTVADLSPEIFDDEYKGKQKESKGVIGLLNIILSDFDRTITTVTDQEALSAEEFSDFKDKTEKDTVAKEQEVETKSATLSQVKDDLVSTTDDKKTATESHQNALEALEDLKKMCVDGQETYAERVAARVKEIEALKQALKILDEWKA